MNKKQNSLMRFSRTERLAQLSEQEIVIERKKKEIQAKIEAQKKKETEEALRKLDSSKETKNNKLGFYKKSSWNRDDLKKEKNKDVSVKQEKNGNLTNAFSNDGSFLDQFKKLSKTGLGPNNVDIQTLQMARKKENQKVLKNHEKDDGHFYKQKREQNINIEYSEKDHEKDRNQLLIDASNSSLIRKPLDSNIQLQLPPPGVVELVPQQKVEIVPVIHSSMQSQIPITSPSSIQPPKIQSTVLNSVLQFTTNELQLKAVSSPSYCETPSLQTTINPILPLSENKGHEMEVTSNFHFNQTSLISHISSIQPPLPLTPQNIPPPSPIQVQNIPPPPMPPKKIEFLPKIHTESISLTIKNNPIKKLESIPNPLDVEQIPSPPAVKENKFNFSKNKIEGYKQQSSGFGMHNFHTIPLPERTSSHDEESLRISSALYNDPEGEQEVGDWDEKHCNIAQIVARCGDDFENSLFNRNESDSSLRFLADKNSREYLSYRKLVQKYRKNLNSVEEEKSERPEKRLHLSNFLIDDEEFDEKKNFKYKSEENSCDINNASKELSNKNSSATKTVLNHITYAEKKNDGYQADNEDDLPYYKMPDSSKKSCFFPSQKDVSQTGMQSENSEIKVREKSSEQSSEEKRKRKRKSRWGDVVATSSSSQIPIATNLALQSPGKLPLPKTTLLTQLTRSDPGLIQYAKQTFGSTNLSEEDWKKAEDHYKINLLYQDLVKKRAEIDKLEKAGKFKYEYDSDEDIEGGTWEHKLRQQEMMATQLWAEELTRQAAGKHHIGDFLPPEELERFMEKYNAVKEGREPDLSDYKEFKLKQDNVGYRLLQKMGWNEGEGLGQDGSGITNPVNKATTRHENQGLGIERPDGLEAGDDEYDAYRKRMMLAYRFRPNPLNNPRRPYY